MLFFSLDIEKGECVRGGRNIEQRRGKKIEGGNQRERALLSAFQFFVQ